MKSSTYFFHMAKIWRDFQLHQCIFKVARVVKLKLAFLEWFFYNLVILIKLYKIWDLNLGKALLFLRSQAICLKNWRLWRSPTATKFNIFCWNFAHVFYLTMSTKGVRDFSILIRSWIINKNVKSEWVGTRSFLIFANNSRSKQNKTSFCRHW